MGVRCRFFLKDISDERFLKHKQDMLRKMENYLKTTGCRRRFRSCCFLRLYWSQSLSTVCCFVTNLCWIILIEYLIWALQCKCCLHFGSHWVIKLKKE